MEETVRIVPHIKASAAWNLALEEALLIKAKERLQKGKKVDPIVHTYSFNKPTVVLGYEQQISEIDMAYCQEQDVHVTMRKSGGGSVFLSSEEIQYGLILAENYTPKLLSTINKSLIDGFNDQGIHPQLVKKDGQDILRHHNRGFVFDAQKRILLNSATPGTYQHLLLHHGTILIDDEDYDHMPSALKASDEDLKVLEKGNIWLREKEQVKSQSLIKSLTRNLSKIGAKAKVKDVTEDEYALAKKLYNEYYNKPDEWDGGKKKFGICYRTDTPYDMEDYSENETINQELEVTPYV